MLKRKKRVNEKVTPLKRKPIKKYKRLKKNKTTSVEKEQMQRASVPPRLREDRSKINFKKRAKRNRQRRRILLGIFMLLILLCVMFFAPFFNISRIEVTGISRMTEDEVISSSGVITGSNIFSLNLNNVKKNIKDIPYVNNVKVKRGFPNVLKLIVTETEPFAYIKNNDNQFILIDQEGSMLEITEALPQMHLLELKTQKIENPVLGQTFLDKNENNFKKYLAIRNEIVDNNIIDKVSLIDVSIDYELNIKYNQLEVKFGENINSEELDYRLTSLQKILEKIGENAKGRVDLSIKGQFVYKEMLN